jgi:histidinol-phosphate phosphatase family protein
MHLKDWTLFLDRDGVINVHKRGGYIQNRAEFQFLPKKLEVFKKISEFFGTVLVVTNQQGIAKGLMTEDDLNDIHNHMLDEITTAGGHINKVYFCPDFAYLNPPCRKPNTGMALKAKEDFPEIDFSKSVMVGDSDTDIEFGKSLGMLSVWIDNGDKSDKKRESLTREADYVFASLEDFVSALPNVFFDRVV